MTIRDRLTRAPLYPALIVGLQIAHLATTGDLPFPWMLRPVLAALAVVLVIQVAATVVLRAADHGAMLAMAIWPWLVGESETAVRIAAAVLIVEAVHVVLRLRHSVVNVPRMVTRGLNVFAVAFAFVTGIGVIGDQLDLAPLPATAHGQADATSPDIFVIVLDGYPRSDTLRDEYG